MITVKHHLRDINVEERLRITVNCKGCDKPIDIVDLADVPKVISHNLIKFFCNFNCLYDWTKTVQELKETAKKLKEKEE